MAGTFTHFTICDVTKAEHSALGRDLWQLLNNYYYFLFLGAASPDLPYLSFKTGAINWADVMHYEKTNGTFETAYAALRTSWHSRTASDEAMFVWLMGYVSHLVIDATIHPVVQAIVGPYQEHKEQHRLCEMAQDSLIYNIHRNGDIRYAEFLQIIGYCSDSIHFGTVMDFWKGQLLANYSEKGEEPHPTLWFTTYKDAIDAASGDSAVVALFRHIGLGTNYIYKTKQEIETAYPDDHINYFETVKLPGDKVGIFTDVFQKAVNNVSEAWKMVYGSLTGGTTLEPLIKNWNLDTGVDMDSPEKTVTYWT
jgi:hypothetical protein